MSITTVIVPDHTHLTALPDADLLALQAEIAASQRRLGAAAAAVSGELLRRSAPELGDDGLARRLGARTPEKLVQQVTGVSHGEARTLVRVGEILGGASPWLSSVARAVTDGDLSLASAHGIIAGLGAPTNTVAADDLADAADRLVDAASGCTPESLAAAARAVRDDLDLSGVADREAALREKRFLRLIPEPDGMTRLIGRLDPESAAIVVAAIDRVTAPRRGGPRFVDPAEQHRAERLRDDARSTEQIAADALVDMVRLAGTADEGRLFGVRTPEVTVHVALADLESGEGSATIDGQTARVSAATARRFVCASGVLPILFDGSRPVDVGRTHRLFTAAQRAAMAARDGGCVFPGCDRPPSWCEAHHTDHWRRDRGRTAVDAGVLLCRHHHLLVHNAGWEIRRLSTAAGVPTGELMLIPPVSVDPTQRPRALQSRTTRDGCGMTGGARSVAHRATSPVAAPSGVPDPRVDSSHA